MPSPNRPLLTFLLFLLIPSVYFVTTSVLMFGYSATMMGEAMVWADGGVAPHCPGGIVDVLVYLPAAWLRVCSNEEELLQSVAQLLPAFIQPGLSALLCLVFFGFSRHVYRSTSVAVGLTLTLAFTTMVWPYSKFGMEATQTLLTLAAAWFLVIMAEGRVLRGGIPFALAMGLLALSKVTGVVHCAVLTVAMVWLMIARGRWRQPGFAGKMAPLLIIGLAALHFLFLSNRMRYGWPYFVGRYNMEVEVSSGGLFSNLFGVLFGSGESIFLFNPPLIVSVFLLPRFLRRFRNLQPIHWALLALALIYLSLVNYFHDETWGPRRFHFLVPFLLLPLGCLFERWREIQWPRRIAMWGVLVAGFAVQLLGVCFDYSSHAMVMGLGNSQIYTVENCVWQPQLNPIRFNAHLARSAWSRTFKGESIDYVVEPHWIPWHRPEVVPEPIHFDVSGHDKYDFWWLQQSDYMRSEEIGWHGDIPSMWGVLLIVVAWCSMIALIVIWRRPVDQRE